MYNVKVLGPDPRRRDILNAQAQLWVASGIQTCAQVTNILISMVWDIINTRSSYSRFINTCSRLNDFRCRQTRDLVTPWKKIKENSCSMKLNSRRRMHFIFCIKKGPFSKLTTKWNTVCRSRRSPGVHACAIEKSALLNPRAYCHGNYKAYTYIHRLEYRYELAYTTI